MPDFNLKIENAEQPAVEIKIGKKVQKTAKLTDTEKLKKLAFTISQDLVKNHADSIGPSVQVTRIDDKEVWYETANKRFVIHRHEINAPSPSGLSFLETFDKESVWPNETKAEKVLRTFISPFNSLFKSLSGLFDQITGRTGQKMERDFQLLQEVGGLYTAEGKITLGQTLSYFSKLLRRERTQQDESLIRRIEKGADLAKKIESLQKQYPTGIPQRFVPGLVEQARSQVQSLDVAGENKALIPVGFMHQNQMVQLMMEVEKKDQKTCAVRLYSLSEQTKALFGGGDLEHGFVREFQNVQIQDLEISLRSLIELQMVTPKKEAAKEGEPTPDLVKFNHSLNFPGATLVHTPVEEFKRQKSGGPVEELMVFLRTHRPDDSRRFIMSTRIRVFLDVCNKNSRWMENPRFREIAITTAYRLIDELNQQKEAILSPDQIPQELTDVLNETQQVLRKLETRFPSLSPLSKETLPALKSGPIKLPPIEQVPKLVQGTLEAPRFLSLQSLEPPDFTKMNSKEIVAKLAEWNERLKQLDDAKETTRMMQELETMVFWLPMPPSIELRPKFGSVEEWKGLIDEIEKFSDLLVKHRILAKMVDSDFGRTKVFSEPNIQTLLAMATLASFFKIPEESARYNHSVELLISILNFFQTYLNVVWPFIYL